MANKRKDDLRKKIQDLRAKGWTLEEISAKMDISVQVAAYYSKSVIKSKKIL